MASGTSTPTLPDVSFTTSTTGTTSPATSVVAPTSPPVEAPVCLAGDTEFVTGGLAATFGESSGDAAAVGGIRWAAHDGCERLVIDLLTADGAPAASLGEVSVSFRSELGVIRIELPVRTTAIADSVIEGEIVDRVYVVRRDNGELAVDVHLGDDKPVRVRGFDVGEPSRVVLDIAPFDDGIRRIAPPSIDDVVVLFSPLGGPDEYPLTISGYARTFEANVVAELSQDAAVLESTFTTASDWLEAWGEFELTIDSGPSGEVTLFVGEFSARDGSPMGVELRLDMS